MIKILFICHGSILKSPGKARKINGFARYGNQQGHSISNVLCDMESVRKEQKIMQEKLLYLQVKSELKAAKSGKKP